MSNRTFVIGVGMTKFEKPGAKDGDYPDMGAGGGHARRSRTPASPTTSVEQAYVGYCYGDSTSGQRAVYGLGLTGIPVVNVNNNCSTGSIGAVHGAPGGPGRARRLRARARLREDGEGLARREVHRPHEPDRQARRGDVRGARAGARRRPRRRCSATPAASTWSATARSPTTTRGSAGRTTSTRSTTRTRSSRTSTRSRTSRTAKMIHEPLTKLQCSPTSDGSALRDRRLRALRRRARPVGPGGRDRRPGDGHRHALDASRTAAAIKIVGYDMSQEAARARLRGGRRRRRRRRRGRAARLLLSANELITYEALGLAEEGEGHKLVDDEATTYGGALGRQPLRRPDLQGPPARRDRAGAVLGADVAAARHRPTSARSRARRSALQHNIGLGGAAVVTVYKPAA